MPPTRIDELLPCDSQMNGQSGTVSRIYVESVVLSFPKYKVPGAGGPNAGAVVLGLLHGLSAIGVTSFPTT